MKTYDYELPVGAALYRYDVISPPVNWDVSFKNPEYLFTEGAKNKAGAFFFFNSEDQAVKTAEIVKLRYNGRYENAWLTCCSTQKTLKLLNMKVFPTVSSLICSLFNDGIDFLTDDFFSDGLKKNEMPLSIMRDPIIKMIAITSTDSQWYLVKEKNDFVNMVIKLIEKQFMDNTYLGIFAQKISDFDNGIAFKKLLIESSYDGYIFNESNGRDGSDTICLYDKDSLTPPLVRQLF